VLTCSTVVAVAAMAGIVGADSRWLAALGGYVVHRNAIPEGVPFAAAPTQHWHNAIVLAELLFHWLELGLRDRGLMLAQLLAVAGVVIVLMKDARAGGAAPTGAGAAVLVATLGALGSLVVARVQLFSLILFCVLMALLRSEARQRSWRIWLALPLIALWSNLHGAVLIGVGIMLVYLVLVRLREQPWTAVGVGAGSLVALCATPAGVLTVSYYRDLLTNEAASSGSGMWAPLTLSAPLDLLMLLAAVMLLFALRRARPRIWELIVIVVLVVATITASRTGIWLMLFLAVPAARGWRSTRWWDWIMPPVAALALVGIVFAIARGPLPSGAGSRLIMRAVELAHGSPILADDIIDEQVAMAGGRIWVGNPIDAFSKQDQLSYLAWLDGRPGGRAAIRPDVNIVLTDAGTPAHRLMAVDSAFKEVSSDGRSELYVRLFRPNAVRWRRTAVGQDRPR
jgi:hypothetical protein